MAAARAQPSPGPQTPFGGAASLSFALVHDAELVRTTRGGRVSGFDAIFDRHVAGVHDLALAVTGDRGVALEIVDATFHEASLRLADLAAEDRLRVWLLAVARHQSALRAGPTAGSDHPQLQTADDPQRDRQADLVWGAVAQLPPVDRTLLDLQLRQALEGRDLTDALGVDLGQVQDVDRRVQAIDRALAGHLVASTNDGRCSRLARLLDGWDGRFDVQDRRGIAGHVERCRTCTQASSSLPPPLSVYAAALTAAYPAEAPRPVVLVLKVLPDRSPGPGEGPPAEPPPPPDPASLPLVPSPSASAGPEVDPPADGLLWSSGGAPAAGAAAFEPPHPAPPAAVDGGEPRQQASAWTDDGFPPPSFPPLERLRTRSAPGRRVPGRGRWLAAAAILAVVVLGGTLLAVTRDDQRTALRSGSTSTSAALDVPLLIPEATTLPPGTVAPPPSVDPASTVPVPGTTVPVAPSTAATTPGPAPGAAPGVLVPSLEVLSIPTVDLATGPQRAALPLRNTGGSPLTYATRSSFAGLSVDRPTGTIGPGATIEVVVTLDGATAGEGGFSGLLTFDGSGGTQQVTVTSKVGRRPVLRDDAGEACTVAGVTCSKVVQLVPGSSPDPRPTLCNTPWRYSVTVEDQSRLKAVVADSNLAGRDAQLTKDGAASGTGGRWQSQVFPPLPPATSLDVSIQAVDEFDFSSVRVERNIAC